MSTTVRGVSTRERADAARNRAKVLSAAETLFADKGAENVTMDDIAKAAGVGRGTLYRRYPDRAAIAVALLDEHERKLQEQLIRGDPPLGPGAPPAERLAAFYAAMLDLLAAHGHLVLGSEIGHQRFGTGAYGFWRVHVHALLAAAGLPDPDGMVDAVLAPLAPELFRYQRERGVSLDRLKVNLRELALRLCGLPGDAADHA
ncbi:TetR/AcrR family transcriptional regulator [Amycolatopsis magusensis]|uniref:TetR/AcrR family transcriptional regulator n=1 Tax=Amycolatopsis magusensis TaxID=882444 RepID=UPI0037A3D0E3